MTTREGRDLSMATTRSTRSSYPSKVRMGSSLDSWKLNARKKVRVVVLHTYLYYLTAPELQNEYKHIRTENTQPQNKW